MRANCVPEASVIRNALVLAVVAGCKTSLISVMCLAEKTEKKFRELAFS